MPQISIITVNYNNKEGLKRTLKSIKQQKFRDFEHIIIDAASKDGSLEVIKSYENQICYWASEPDRGIYHGMNKGISVAKGRYLLFLNSGDYLINEHALDIQIEKFNEDILYGHLTHNKAGALRASIYNQKLDVPFFLSSTLPHGSTFIKRTLFTKYGDYRTDYKIVSDWIFFLERILIDNCSTYHLAKPISVFEVGGISTRPENAEKVKSERDRYLVSILPKVFLEYIRVTLQTEKERNELNTKLIVLQGKMNNLLRLKGIKLLKRFNNIIDVFYNIIIK